MDKLPDGRLYSSGSTVVGNVMLISVRSLVKSITTGKLNVDEEEESDILSQMASDARVSDAANTKIKAGFTAASTQNR